MREPGSPTAKVAVQPWPAPAVPAGIGRAGPARPWVTLQQAGVRLGATQALAAVTLQVQPGERIALVGANGSGKTTLLRALHGLLALSDGQRLVQAPTGGAAPRVAMLFQRPFLLRLPVLANVTLGLWLARVPAAERRARAMEALQRVGLAELSHRLATSLSGGQQQRLALARAWALQPELLLLDEPTASLDPSAKREIEALIDDFMDHGAARGVSVVMASHNLGQVKRLARRVIYLERGRVLADVSPDRFFNGEVPPEAAKFLKGELPW